MLPTSTFYPTHQLIDHSLDRLKNIEMAAIKSKSINIDDIELPISIFLTIIMKDD